MWNTILALMQCSQSKVRLHLKMTAAKVVIATATRLCRASSQRSISSHPSQNGGRSKIIEASKVEMSRYLVTSATTRMADILGQHWRSCDTSRTKFVWTPISRIVVGKTVWRNSIGIWMGKVQNWECLFVHRKQGLFLLVHVDDTQIAGRKQNLSPVWKNWWNWLTWENHQVFLGCTQRDCKSVDSIIEEYKKDVRIRNLCWSNWKVTWMGEISRENSRWVLWQGRSCEGMRGKILRTSKYPSTGNLSSCFFFNLGGLIFLCSYSFWRRSNYFLSSWRVTVFDPGGINIFLFMQFLPLCEIRPKAADAPITWSWHREATRKNSTQESVPWQTVFVCTSSCERRSETLL